MKKHIKTLFLGVVPILTFTLLVSCAEASPSDNTKTIVEVKKRVEEVVNDVVEPEVATVVVSTQKVEEISDTGEVVVEEEEVVVKIDKVLKKKEEPLVEVEKEIEEIVVEEIEEVVIQTVDHSIWNALLKKNVSSTGKVNYKGFKADKAKLLQYITLLKSKAPSSDWTKNEKLAYWINVYNVFTVKLIIDNYPLKSITNLDKPWDKKIISIQGKTYSLGDVENNILRKMGESRIHFAINCASVSCPKLLNEAFTADKLSSQLRSVTKSFFSDKTKNQLTDGSLKISKLFEWYAADFSKGNVIAYINKYSGQTVGTSSKVSYLEYNWNLNE